MNEDFVKQNTPENWEKAREWEEKANRENEEGPQWSWDCSFKLDYDGPILKVSSRFYPPTRHYGEGWDGSVKFYFLGEKIFEKKFECETLDELKEAVEAYLKRQNDIIKSRIKP